MSDDDFWVKKLSNEEVAKYANNIKNYFGIESTRPVNIVKCLQSDQINTVLGIKNLAYRIIPDVDMGETDGSTELIDDTIVVRVRESVHRKALWGDGRSRMTLAHELGHVVLHPGVAKFRKVGAHGVADHGRIPAMQSAEHQAKLFASAFLIHDSQISEMTTATEVSEQFGVSLEAAKIAFKISEEKKDRSKNLAKILKIAEDFKKSVEKTQLTTNKYIDDYCSCGAQKLIPIGMKYLCDECGQVSDRFQDGDKQN